MIVTLVLWAVLGVLALLDMSALAAMARERAWRDAAHWDAPLLLTCAAVALLTALGILAVLPGAFLALVPLLALGWSLRREWRALADRDGKGKATWRVLRALAAHVRDSALNARDDVRALRGRARKDTAAAPAAPAPGPRPAAVPQASPAQAQAREVPPARDDPALAPAPEPTEVAAGLAEANVEIPEPWAQLIYHVASRVAPTSADQERFLYGDAAGFIALCEAYHSGAGNAVDEIGLDPAFGEALLDIGDAVAPVSGDVIQAVRRFRAIYEGIISFAENGGVLPFNTRDFFGGHGGNPPQDGAGEAA